jgi:4-hydroxy-2-oxoglutarate aldolase
VVGIKESSGDLVKIGQVAAGTDDRFQVLAGSGGFFLAALDVGAVGGVAAVACVAADIVCEIMETFEREELTEARKLQSRLIPVNTAVTTRFGIPGLKAALDLIGLYGGPVRSPLIPLNSRDRQTIEEILKEAAISGGQESLHV